MGKWDERPWVSRAKLITSCTSVSPGAAGTNAVEVALKLFVRQCEAGSCTRPHGTL